MHAHTLSKNALTISKNISACASVSIYAHASAVILAFTFLCLFVNAHSPSSIFAHTPKIIHECALQASVLMLTVLCVCLLYCLTVNKEIYSILSIKYYHRVIKHVNERDNKHETQTKKLCTGLVMYQDLATTVTIIVILGYL